MRHKKGIAICLTLLFLMIASVAQADLVFDEEEHGGTFTQAIVHNARVTVGDIPVGVEGLFVELNCAADVDIELWDLDEDNYAVIAYEIGLKQSAVPITFNYKGMSITYSGWDGVDNVLGHETIAISGATTANLRIIAFGYAPGTATVNYTYTEYVPVDTGYDLTYTAGPHGSITGEANQTVNHAGTGTAVTAVPDDGYHFVDWSDGVVTATRTDSEVMGDLAVTANFAINNYTLTYAAGEHGSIAGDTEQQVNHGASGMLVTAQPDPGYYFVNWSDGNDTAARRDVDVTGEISVTAIFAPKVAITVTADGQSKVYGNDDPSFTYQVTDGALEGGDSFSGLLGRAAGEDVGSYQIDQGTLSAGPKYQITFVPADLAISQRSLQVTANSREKTYGEPDPALTHQVTGGSLVNGDQLTGALTRLSGEDVGEYQILQGTLTAGGNYALSFVPASLSVNVKTIQVTADAKSKHYGDADPSLTYQVTGLVGTDALTGSLTRVAGEEINSYAINQGDLSAGGNYLINFTPGMFAVTRRPLTVTAVDVTKVYDGQSSSFDVSYAGFAPDEDASALAGTLVISGDAVGATSAGEYTIVPGGLISGNYQIAFVSGQLSIQPRALTVTADDQQKIYDGAPFEGFTASYSGFVSGEDERVLDGTLSFDGDAVTLTSAGSHEIAPGGLVSSNYAITFVSGTLTIHKRPVTVTAHDQGKVYGEADPVLTYSLTTGELVESDSLSGTPTRTAGEGVGEYAIKIGSVQISDNYAISFVQGKLTVTEREIALLADAKSKIYGDPDPVFTYQMTSGTLVGGDNFSGALSRVAGVAVGSYQIGLGSLTAGDNYRITLTPANLVITAKEITITAGDQSKTYGDEDPALTYHVAGLVSGDSCSGALQRQAGETVGLYPISQGSLTAGANYTISFVAGELAINPRPLTVTAAPCSKQYDGLPYSDFGVNYDGFISGDDADAIGGELAFGGSAVGATRAGSYEIVPSGLASGNYAITFVPGTLTINKRPLTIAADDKTKVYDGDAFTAFSVSYSGFAGNDDEHDLVGPLVYGGSAATEVNAGTFAIVPAGPTSDNYNISFVNGELTITKRQLVATVGNYSKIYGSDNPGFIVDVTGFIPGEDAGTAAGYSAPTASCGATATTGVGTAEVAVSGGSADNYSFQRVPGTMTINRKELIATAIATGKTYDGTTAASGSINLSGIVNEDDVTATGTFRFADPNAGLGKAVQVTDIALAGDKAGNYTLTSISANATADISKADISGVGFLDASLDYDGYAHELLITGEELPIGASVNYSSNVGTGAGTYPARAEISGGQNYNDLALEATLQIRKAPLTVTVNDTSKTYGETNPGFVLHVGGFAREESEASAAGYRAPTAECVAGETTAVGTVPITISAGLADNYYFDVSHQGTLTITKKELTAKAVDCSKTYGSGNPEFAVEVTGFIPGENAGNAAGYSAPTAACTATDATDVGAVEIVLSGGSASNYSFRLINGALTINRKPLTATATAEDKVYDGSTAAEGEIQLAGIVGGDAVTANGSFVFANAEAGTGKLVNVSGILLNGLKKDNYTVNTTAVAEADINPKPLTAVIQVDDKFYDGNDTAVGRIGLQGVVGDDDVVASGSFRFADRNVGTGIVVTVSEVTLSGEKATSYTVANTASGSANINPRPITVTADTLGKVYGEADPALSYRVTAGALVDGDAISGSLTRQPGESAGNYTIEGALSAGGNYQLSYVPAEFTVQRRPLTVTADVQSKVYGDADPEFTYAVTAGSLVGGDAFQGSLTRDAGEDVDGYAIQQGTLTPGSNYELTYVSKDLTISQRPIMVTAEAKTKVYGEADPALTYQITLGELVSGDAFSGGLARADGTSAGTYEILQGTLTASDNYALTYVSADLEITRKEISAAGITARSKYWDGVAAASLNTSNASLVGLEPGDDVQLDVSHASGTFADANLGANKQVTVTGLALVGGDAGNYLLNAYTTTASIMDEPEPPKPPTPPADNSGVVIIVNGEVQEQSATATTTVVEDKTITTVMIDPQKLAERLEQEGENSTVTVPVNTGADVVTGTLTGQSVKQMEAKSAVLEIKTENVTYTLPAAQINIDAVAEQIGGNVSLQDVNVRVQVAAPAADTARVVEDTANRNNYQVVVKPVEFSVTCEHAGRVVEVNRFNAYVERMVAVPDGVDPSKITTGIVLNADGTFSHVPTTIVVIDGKYYAKINSLTNSVYSVIWNPIEFQDMVGHWAKGPVNDMGSRLVMEGDSNEVFGPNRAITRGEFAATIVKALGLRPATGDSPFVDLHADDQYYGHILTAYQYGIMNGLPGNRFGAETELTRQEAMAIVVSAMRLTELSSTLSSTEVNAALATYADSARVSGWARNVVAACLKSGVIGGRPGQLIAPQEMITRAEAAAIMQRFLRQSGLI